ncbi:hypothetical protein BGX24_006321 [Mortierella sp. AD032]|nr:hypothetical protein BGX24_006321 [Mortierella sp. AD032]
MGERRQFADLERLYHQTGGLVEVEYLNLRGVYLDKEGNTPASAERNTDMCTIPVILSLHDEENGHPGYFESRAYVRVTTDEIS